MKKKKLILCLMCLISISTFAQTERKHHFGFGATTTIFAGELDLDNFKKQTFRYDDITILLNLPFVRLDLTTTIFYSFYLEYEYDFAKRWSASTRLKYNYRDQYYHYEFSDYSAVENQRGTAIAGLSVAFEDLEVPLILNYKIPLSQNLNFVASLGAGLSFNLSKTVPNFDGKGYAVSIMNRVYHIDFEVLKNITYFLYFGTAFDFTFNNHKLQTRISYTMYPQDIYKWNHWITGNGISARVDFPAFSQNNIEIGLAFFL